MELDDGADSIGREFDPDAEDGLLMEADGGVDDRLRTGQFCILDHLVQSRSLGLGLLAATDAEDIRGRSFTGHGLDHGKVILRKDDVGLQLILIDSQAARSAAAAHQQNGQANGCQYKQFLHNLSLMCCFLLMGRKVNKIIRKNIRNEVRRRNNDPVTV